MVFDWVSNLLYYSNKSPGYVWSLIGLVISILFKQESMLCMVFDWVSDLYIIQTRVQAIYGL